ncbi:tRNA (adenine-N(1))-methyltransferase [Bacillus luteolus]|uniref:tRNA (Adenine-N(1))-methyltransferase n=1 Tax=Litchfieldia luteola TaxID=682179 RepID=A0ABR9QHM4_9BACI|nr:tRNA (adenine(22)-N(1))-methyltransferase TrmK [Cytobacillus luteolus]MBE4908005.1 tRNA (adenine-N(1))-methyltransferase [Cytobacillus luteolus]MBP1942788.1 tRNA (adenine22-N1)-methyltransferase [Cytobacillus luteolus]
MNELRLSKRLETVANYIPKNSILADIGSDHAYLPCFASLRGSIKKGIAGEITEGPLQSAKEQVAKSGLSEMIDVRKGDGLEVIEPNEVTCITIAGMGGTLIRSILEKGKAKLTGVERLILQPNIGAHRIREWLLDNGWELTAEEILEEDGKIYEILVSDKGNPKTPYDSIEAGVLLGPFLMKEKNEVFIKKWINELNHWEKIISQLEHAEKTEENNKRKEELIHNSNIVREVLK